MTSDNKPNKLSHLFSNQTNQIHKITKQNTLLLQYYIIIIIIKSLLLLLFEMTIYQPFVFFPFDDHSQQFNRNNQNKSVNKRSCCGASQSGICSIVKSQITKQKIITYSKCNNLTLNLISNITSTLRLFLPPILFYTNKKGLKFCANIFASILATSFLDSISIFLSITSSFLSFNFFDSTAS